MASNFFSQRTETDAVSNPFAIPDNSVQKPTNPKCNNDHQNPLRFAFFIYIYIYIYIYILVDSLIWDINATCGSPVATELLATNGADDAE
jgi:hypothetical protein